MATDTLAAPATPKERYQIKLLDILERSASLFAEHGYHHTSVRDISREMNISLAGLYYYFKTKEDLLFLISKHSFDTVVSALDEKLTTVTDPEDKLRTLVRNHLQYFVTHLDAMKVLAHESDSLTGQYFRIIHGKKKAYLERLEGILLEILRRRNPQAKMNGSVKTAALSLFGMMNWIYTWYNPARTEPTSANIRRLADDMIALFLEGFLNLGK